MLRVLWLTNSCPEGSAGEGQGDVVAGLWAALLRTGRVHLEREAVVGERGALDYLTANVRVRRRWDAGRFHLVHVHHGLTGLATLMLPTPVTRVFTFYGRDIEAPAQRAISVATARRAARRIFVTGRLADVWPSPLNVVLPSRADLESVAPANHEAAHAAWLGRVADGTLTIYEEVAGSDR